MRVDVAGFGPVDFPDDWSDQQISDAGRKIQTEHYSKMGVGELLKTAAGNVPSSAYQYGANLVGAVAHPIDTATAIGKTAAGAAQAATGGALGTGYQPYWNALREEIGGRYGSMAGFKRAFATDPIGIASDLSIPFTLGASGVEALPGTAARVTGAVMRATDPLVAAGRVAQGAGKAAMAGQGMLTGVHTLPFERLWGAAIEGGQRERDFVQSMRHGANAEELVDDVMAATRRMQEQASANYRSGTDMMRADQRLVSPHKIEDAIQSVEERGKHTLPSGKVSVIEETAAAKVDKARQKFDEFTEGWRGLYPKMTLKDMDAYKKHLGDIMDSIPFNEKNARGAVKQIKDAVSETITTADPQYAAAMAGYERSMRKLEEVQKTFSVGNKRPNPDTVARKVLSAARNNVNANFLQRQRLAEQMEQLTGRNILDKASGAALSSWIPRGLAAIPAEGMLHAGLYGALHGLGNPVTAAAAVPGVLASSPRLMGEANLAAARLARYPYRAIQATPELARQAARYGILGGQQIGRWTPGAGTVTVRPYQERLSEQ